MSSAAVAQSWKQRSRSRLPLTLLDLTLAQARHHHFLALASGTLKNGTNANGVFGRRAHALALAPAPDVRGGYLNPNPSSSSSTSTRENVRDGGRHRGGLLDRRRRGPTSITKDVRVRRPGPIARNVPFPSSGNRKALLLHDRVEALVRRTGTVDAGRELTKLEEKEKDNEGEELYYNDAELRDLYADLLAHPEAELEAAHHGGRSQSLPQSEAQTAAQAEVEAREERKAVLESVVRRLVVDSDESESIATVSESTSLASRLAARRREASSVAESGEGDARTKDESASDSEFLNTLRTQLLDSDKAHHEILLRVADVVRSVEHAQKDLIKNVSTLSSPPIAVLSAREWDALVHTCIDQNELDVAESSLLLMKRTAIEPAEDLVNSVLTIHAAQGDVSAVMSLFQKLAIGKPTERQRDLHIKSHLKSPSPNHGIPSALQVLHQYEALALLPPVKSYTRVICALFSERSAQFQAQAWDLFAHMRYVAHGRPDPVLYALMIRACAGTGYSQSGYAADPVRALDLWTEMTTEAGYEPTVGAYNAVILACARSSEYVVEAFRLAREMLDGHRDAYGHPLMHATRETFDALLVAAKTRKDLPRARWILAEMLKIHEQGVREGRDREGNLLCPDARTVMHVFHAYTSYKPPFKRGATTIVDGHDLKSAQETDIAGNTLGAPQTEIEKTDVPKAPFRVTAPQTHSEVLAEADALFERIISESGAETLASQSSETDTGTRTGPFARVSLTTAVLNSYLSVHYMHDTLENARRLYGEVFRRTGVERSARTYVEALERCAKAGKMDRGVAREFADDVWGEWKEVESTLDLRSADARLIERAYVAMIRMNTLIGGLDKALSLVRAFSTRYPPRALSRPSSTKPEMRSTRTLLYASRPLVRLTTPSEVQDDTVPPLLTSRDLELLHHRLVAAGPERQRDVDYLTYLGHAYVGALRKRRDRTIRA